VVTPASWTNPVVTSATPTSFSSPRVYNTPANKSLSRYEVEIKRMRYGWEFDELDSTVRNIPSREVSRNNRLIFMKLGSKFLEIITFLIYSFEMSK
jgi:hypothetical protein